MCGIVGLHLRTPELYPRLGELLTGMLCEMGDRGSDSAGVAVYGDPILVAARAGVRLACSTSMPTAEPGIGARRQRRRPASAPRICYRRR